MNKKGLSIKSASSSIRDHINETDHAASLDDICILEKSNNNFGVLIQESLLIQRVHPTFNQQNSSIPLNLFVNLTSLSYYSISSCNSLSLFRNRTMHNLIMHCMRIISTLKIWQVKAFIQLRMRQAVSKRP